MRTLLLALFAGASFAADAADHGVRFDSPGVLDLAQHTSDLHSSRYAPLADLAATEAAEILAAPSIGVDQPVLKFSEDEYGCKPEARTCAREHERALLALTRGAVVREGARLTLKSDGAAAVTFSDWTRPETKTADGDSEGHWYLGALAGSGYWRVEVQFGHDAPGNFLINPQSGKVAFVHNGSDVVASSPDGLYLLTFNPDNPPVTLRVAALDAAGPRVELQCNAGDGHESIEFKGWHGVESFDLTLVPRARSRLVHALPMRLTRAGGVWTLAGANAGEWLACWLP